MTRRIVVVQGHPDAAGGHFCHALAEAYATGAAEAKHELEEIAVAALDLPLLRRRDDWESGEPPSSVQAVQEALRRADHLLLVYPLWLGTMPALLKGFLEQLLRPGFAFRYPQGRGFPQKLLKGKSARIVVTMGMPALFYRLYFRAHSLRSLERNILGFCGFSPVWHDLVGSVEESQRRRERWLARMRRYGRQGH